jgi:hypothetical protein
MKFRMAGCVALLCLAGCADPDAATVKFAALKAQLIQNERIQAEQDQEERAARSEAPLATFQSHHPPQPVTTNCTQLGNMTSCQRR